jgi:nucleotide-binding universal stress UspA family protein
MKILIAVDGSRNSLDAVTYVIEHMNLLRKKPAVELVTVHLPVPQVGFMSSVVSKSQTQKYYVDEGNARLASARRKLDAAKVGYESHILVGPVAESIVKHAKRKGCDLLVIGTRGMSNVGKAIMGSTAGKVLHISDIPVLLVK